MATDSEDAVDLDAKFNELMSLSPADRLALGERLIESVPMFATPEEERAFNEEIARRIDDYESGRVQGIPAEQVFVELHERLHKMRDTRTDR
jgi:putative addiction module component (TIGR02574 family)